MKPKGNSTRIIKKANEHLVLRTLKENEAISVESIVSFTKLSRPTVLNILKELDIKGLLETAGLGESMGGRQPVLYQLNLSNYFSIGIDLEFPPMRLAICNLKEKIVFSKNWRCSPDMAFEDIQNQILSAINEGLDSMGIDMSNIIGIALGIPGRVDIRKNIATHMTRIRQWNGEDIVSNLKEKTGVPIMVCNDLHLLAVAEHRHQPTQPETFIYMARRQGIGGAVFIKNKNYEGNFGNSAYMGHVVVQPGGLRCKCGKNGCLESYASIPSIEKLYAERSGLEIPIAYNEIICRAKDGVLQAQQIIIDAGVKTATVLAAAVQMFDIQTVIFGDEDNDSSGYFVSIIRDCLKEMTSQDEAAEINLLEGQLTEVDYALGGCLHVLNSFFKAPKLNI